MTLEELRGEYESLAACCMHDRPWSPDDVAEVLCWVWRGDGGTWRDGPKDETESEGIIAVKLADGRYGLLTESEDYTGHGCQCNSATGVYASAGDMLRFGVPDEGAAGAIRERLAIPGMVVADSGELEAGR